MIIALNSPKFHVVYLSISIEESKIFWGSQELLGKLDIFSKDITNIKLDHILSFEMNTNHFQPLQENTGS